jgi:Xaa-Pro aminopeptidase
MHNSRLAAVRGFLSRGPYSSIIISDPVDVEYLTGFRSSNVYCVVSRRKNLLCSDFRYRSAALAFCRRNDEWIFLEIKENDFSFLRSALKKKSVTAFQADVFTVSAFSRLRRACPGVGFAKLPPEFADVFVPKTSHEISRMKKAAAIGDRVFNEMFRAARPGITERELAGFCEERCGKYGSQRPSFETIVLFGRRAALPHGIPSDARLKRGDWVLCDFGCTVDGFASDMTRTFVMGRASDVQKRIYGTVLEAQETARRAVTAGALASDIDGLARGVISAAGLGPLFGHATGHGVGLRVHEKPRISASDKSILQPGTVITVEPGVYHPAWGGVRIEDMVAVRHGGGETLTSSPRELMEAGTR